MKKFIKDLWMYITIPFKIIYYCFLIFIEFKDTDTDIEEL